MGREFDKHWPQTKPFPPLVRRQGWSPPTQNHQLSPLSGVIYIQQRPDADYSPTRRSLISRKTRLASTRSLNVSPTFLMATRRPVN